MVFLFILFLVFIALPLVSIGVSFIGRISPDSVIPDSFAAYVRIPSPVRFIQQILEHEALPELLADPALAAFAPAAVQLRGNKILENRWVRFAVQGPLNGALLPDGRFLAAWEAGILAPFLRILPIVAGRLTIPGLYYVQAGKNFRFEYRMEGGAVIYLGPYRNLLVASNSPDLFESVIRGDIQGSGRKPLGIQDFDIAFLVPQDTVKSALGGQDPRITAVLDQLEFPGLIETAVSIFPGRLEINLSTPLSSANPAMGRLIEGTAQVSPLTQLLPDTTQYSTILSAGSLEELLGAASSVFGPDIDAALKKADSSARLLLRLSVRDLLFSWTGREFAVFGMEGRPNPVYAIQIGDENKRREIFDKAFRSIFINENIQAVLDGTRIPRIQLPDFVDSVLQALGVRVPFPYYIVQDGYLFISESSDALLAALNAIRKNAVLPKTTVWKTLANSASDKASFSLFYSLDRSLPFFLKGNNAFGALLRLYRQGLARLAFENRRITISLTAIPGSGRGIVPVPGYPLDLGERTGSAVYGISAARRGETRVLLTRGNSALALNPADQTIYELKNPHPVYVIPAEGLAPKNMNDPAAWVAGNGQVTLVNGNMEPVRGFPRSTGSRLSAVPAAYGGNLFLCDDDGLVYVVDAQGTVSQWGTVFDAALRAPPCFLEGFNKTYAAFYPKSIIANEIWLSDIQGNPYPGWPVSVSGIAFGSPLIFSAERRAGDGPPEARILTAFITMAGELSVFEENAAVLPNFPLKLSGVFYLQPVFDGAFLWILAEDGTLYQISLDGTVLRQRIPNLTVREAGYITALDVDGDKTPEVFFTGEGNALYGYSRNFISLDGFPLPAWGRPAFVDLNGDGKIECFALGLDNKLYQWQFK